MLIFKSYVEFIVIFVFVFAAPPSLPQAEEEPVACSSSSGDAVNRKFSLLIFR